MENAWQYSKLYACHADNLAEPTPRHWSWAREGWSNPRAIRYPMGRGARPLASLWEGERLDYIAARKRIYVPLYARAVLDTPSYAALAALHRTERVLVLRDFDGYDHRSAGMTLTDVLDCPTRKMGHAFVLAMLLTGDHALRRTSL